VTVWLGVYIGTDEVVNMQQMTETIAVIQMYGVSHIAGVTVGNEYVLSRFLPLHVLMRVDL
jgi:exo-beta-1,3-glucanase (GH17 family)